MRGTGTLIQIKLGDNGIGRWNTSAEGLRFVTVTVDPACGSGYSKSANFLWQER